ncbi:MAG: HAD family hydrolase [Chthoniobacterales bacterium]
MSAPLRLAIWSGPRNISTAMMRAWENRGDTAVVDEPFYAFYLNETHAKHPGAEEVISAGETDWRKVVAQLMADVPGRAQIYYQKQMTHHLLPVIDRSWLAQVTNCFLIREPARVIASYLKKNYRPSATDLGFPQQTEIFETVRQLTNRTPTVIDADDVLRDPARILRLLCEAVGVHFRESMLAWPPGRRASDGVWAKHWYSEVEKSTGFAPYNGASAAVPEELRDVHDECRTHYDKLHALRLT